MSERAPALETAALRALAHPLRVRILDELSMYGPLTASGLGARLGESSGATSYHLRQLEKHGLVAEDAGRGTARERWWMRRPGSITLPAAHDQPSGSAERLATELIDAEWMRRRDETVREFRADGEQTFGPEWLDVASFDTVNLRLTAAELGELMAELDAVIARRLALPRSPSARPVQLQVNAFPLVRGEADKE
ncbi:helix-turn-helix transcriptional regulator [Kribbella sandramycini]|uniref:DNA-binding transcriptional ArsR family regulator n=1 Tax=Kribbella sandramycini TaxID=60450 RepID=A0A7Y4L7J9_9ACTN|nr:helix-turn-helix domain-containing protein [Kribbella sandramycini]MBB6570258.1 DNA-binding transcriptional ArsR family regulator [Kribbella sandramycini]NOL45824.1 helix-turn-helix transcriptional regulator [Kribbella sandramycini]